MIKHIKCDIFESGADVICHQVNCQGVMGSGIAKQVKERFPQVFDEYKKFCNSTPNKSELLGSVLGVYVDDVGYIVNIFAQDKFGYDGKRYTNYKALQNGLDHANKLVFGKTIAIPYLIGCCRGGGNWNVVYSMIEKIFSDGRNDILICEYNGR